MYKGEEYGYYCKSNKSWMCLEDEAYSISSLGNGMYSISSLANSHARHHEVGTRCVVAI